MGKTEKTAQELLQAESDMEVLGSNSFAVLALLLITFVMPFIGILFSEVNNPRVNYTPDFESKQKAPPPVAAPPVPKSEYTSEGINRMSVPDENITDNEIVAMDYSVRRYYFENLKKQASYYRYTKNDLPKAEQKLRLAVRLISRDVDTLNDLGQVLHEQNKYSESLEYLKRSQNIDEKYPATKIYIGINYLKLEKYNDAIDVLKEVTDGDSNSFEAFYNLGLAYEAIEAYPSAVVSFQQASKINPDNTDLHFQLGFCLYKLGNLQATREQYHILLNKDKSLAEQLKRLANLE